MPREEWQGGTEPFSDSLSTSIHPSTVSLPLHLLSPVSSVACPLRWCLLSQQQEKRLQNAGLFAGAVARGALRGQFAAAMIMETSSYLI